MKSKAPEPILYIKHPGLLLREMLQIKRHRENFLNRIKLEKNNA